MNLKEKSSLSIFVIADSTLKADASRLDKIVFLADKIAWDQSYTAPFLAGVLAGLERSLDHAVLHYLHYLWQQRDSVPVVHPWFVDAYEQLSRRCDALSEVRRT